MPRFVIDLGDIEMSKDQESRLAGSLQKTALGALADLKFEQPFISRFPHDWYGLIMRKDIDRIFDADKLVGRALFELQR